MVWNVQCTFILSCNNGFKNSPKYGPLSFVRVLRGCICDIAMNEGEHDGLKMLPST